MRNRITLAAIKRWITALAVLCGGAVCFGGTDPGDLLQQYGELKYAVTTARSGITSEERTNDLLAELDELESRAIDAKDLNIVLETILLKAQVYAGARNDLATASELLGTALDEYEHANSAIAKKLFLKQAELHSLQGDDRAIRKLIERFKKGPHFDPESYDYRGGLGKDVPLKVTRPFARGSASSTVTAMETYAQQARFAAGNMFPDIEVQTRSGQQLRLSNLRGQVVLVDFWLKDWGPWNRELPYLVHAYERYGPAGFEILGIGMDRPGEDLNQFIRRNGMTWPIVTGNRAVPAMCGVFGEARNFLIDRDGYIIARDLSAAEVVDLLTRRLNVGQDRP